MSKPIEATKSKVAEATKSTARVVKNTELLAQAVALLVIAVFAYTNLSDITNKVWFYIVVGSLAIVGLRAAVELVKFLSRGE